MDPLDQIIKWEHSLKAVEKAQCLTEQGKEVGYWAIEQLKRFLGEDWFSIVKRKDHVLFSLHWWNINDSPMAYINLFRLTTQILILEHSQKFPMLRREMRTNHDFFFWLHSLLQLELAGNALRNGWTCRFEPDLRGGTRADLSLEKGTKICLIEVVTMGSSDEVKEINRNFKLISALLDEISIEKGISYSGNIEISLLDETDIHNFVLTFKEGADKVATSNAEMIIEQVGTYKLKITPHFTGETFSGPPLYTDFIRRIRARIKDKSRQLGSGNNIWIYIGEHSGLWYFSPWGLAPFSDKLSQIGIIGREILCDFPNISGIVISNGWNLCTLATDDTIEDKDDNNKVIGLGLKRVLLNTYSKETFLIGRNGAVSDDLSFLYQWFHEEPTWLDWALKEMGFNYRLSDLFKTS